MRRKHSPSPLPGLGRTAASRPLAPARVSPLLPSAAALALALAAAGCSAPLPLSGDPIGPDPVHVKPAPPVPSASASPSASAPALDPDPHPIEGGISIVKPATPPKVTSKAHRPVRPPS